MNKHHIPGEAAIWVFILGDMVMFSMFFGQFVYDRAHQLSLFTESQRSLSVSFGAINTIILLTGSLFVVLGVQSIKQSQQGRQRANCGSAGNAGSTCLGLTAICALIFCFDKVLEYADHLRNGITPATNDFFMYYYMFTSIHALHLFISMWFLGKMWNLSKATSRSPADIRFIESGAGFWHLVDLLWIALFAILYLLP